MGALLKALTVALTIISWGVLVSCQETAKPSTADLKDKEILKKLAQKKLVAIDVHKPEDCSLLSEVQDELQVHYTGYLQTGEIFDSSERTGKDPISVVLGSGQVIKGWEEGLVNMCVGAKRRLIIPPNLGYGKNGYPPVIPPDATLLFEVTLVNLKKHSAGWPDSDQLLHVAQFLCLPGVIFCIFYYLYKRYTAEAKTAKGNKHHARIKIHRKRK